jgi:hypothetical protein
VTNSAQQRSSLLRRWTDTKVATFGEVRIFDFGQVWEFAGRTRPVSDSGAEAHVEDLVTIPAKDLKAAMRTQQEGDTNHEVWLRVVTDGSPDDDLEYLSSSPITFATYGHELVMELEVYDDVPLDQQPRGVYGGRVKPLLERNRMWLEDVIEDHDYTGQHWHVRLRVGFHVRGRTVGALVDDGLEMVELLNASSGGGVTRAVVSDLLRAGHATALLGQLETEWLEVKRQHFEMKGGRGKVRLAQTVAQFANHPDGGVVVIGMATKKVAGADTIHALTPVPRDPTMRRRYTQALQNHLYPPPEGLVVEVVEVEGGSLLFIEVPPQPEELQPFLVQGAILDGEVHGGFISIVRRRDDESVATTAAAIHSTLAAGRALLRRGEIPPRP